MSGYLLSMCASMMRLTSSAMEIPSRLASRFKKTLCGSVNEIICLVKLCLWRVAVGCYVEIYLVNSRLNGIDASHQCAPGGHKLASFSHKFLVKALSRLWHIWRSWSWWTAVKAAKVVSVGRWGAALSPHVSMQPFDSHPASGRGLKPLNVSLEPFGILGSVQTQQKRPRFSLLYRNTVPFSYSVAHGLSIPRGIQ